MEEAAINDRKAHGWAGLTRGVVARGGRSPNTTLVHLLSPSCPHFCLLLPVLEAERRVISGAARQRGGKRSKRKVEDKVPKRKERVLQLPTALQPTRCVLSSVSASASATSLATPSAGARERRCAPTTTKEKVTALAPAPLTKIVRPQILFAQNLGSVNVSATHLEGKSAGEEERVFVGQKVEPQVRRHLDKEEMGGKVENKALAALTQIVQHLIQLARNLAFVSASATSLETKSVGAREKAFVVLKEQQGRQEGQVERKEV